jgi:hypothetical protein
MQLETLEHPTRDLPALMRPRTLAVDWWGWRDLRGGGVRSFVGWVLTMGEVSYEDGLWVQHLEAERRGDCHRYGGLMYCYCEEADDVA